MTTEMADSTRPEMIPAGWTAALYADGEFRCPWYQLRRFPRRIMISVIGDPLAARFARCIDVERYDAAPAQAPGFVAERIRLGHDDATPYCNRASLRELLAELGRLQPRLWVATLDNREWTPQELAADLAEHEGIIVDPLRFWAIQWRPAGPGRDYDTSTIYGEPPS